MKALVFEGAVVQIEANEFPVSPPLEWVDITGIAPTPQVGWAFDGRNFTAPPPPPLPPRKEDAPITAQEVVDELVRKNIITREEFDTIRTSR